MRRQLVVTLIALLPTLSGCGSAYSTVSGKVTYRGRTVTFGSVIFVNADGSARTGVILPDGTYTVEGLKRGWAKIGVLSPDPAHARSILKADENRAKTGHKPGKNGPVGKAASDGWFPLPAKLGDPDKSGLGCDVSAARVEHIIDMQ